MPATYTDRIQGTTTSVAVKAPCRVATTGPITLSGLQTVDGVALAARDRVLVKDQSNAVDNGIYLVTTTAWNRSLDFDGARDAVQGTLVIVDGGTTYANTIWQVTTDDPIVFDTSEIEFARSISDAAYVGFLQAGAGAVDRTVQDRLRETISVKDFAAKGDGVTDDTAAIQAALNYADANGRTVTVPEGTFITGALTIDGPMCLELDAKAVLKLKNSANVNLLTITSDDVTVRGGKLDGNRANQASAGTLIIASGVDRLLIEGVFGTEAKTYGFRLQDGDDLVVRRCRMTNTTSTAIQVFCTADTVNRAIIEGNIIDRSDDAANSDGCIKLSNNSGGTTYKFIGCRIHGNAVKMSTAPSGSNVVPLEIWCSNNLAAENCAITDNFVQGGDFAISMNGNVSGIISGNNVLSPKTYGIEGAHSPHISISSNTVDGGSGTTNNGIILNGASPRGSIVGNTVRNIATAAGSDVGIMLTDTALQCAVTGNNLFNAGTYCIEANGTDGHAICANNVDGNAASSVAIGIVNAGEVAVAGNHIKGVTNGVQIIVNTAATKNNICVQGNVISASSSPVLKTLSGGGALGTAVQVVANAGPIFGDNIGYMAIDYQNSVLVAVGTTANPSSSAYGVGSLFLCRQGVASSGWLKEASSGQTAVGFNPIQTIRASTTANRPSLGSGQAGYRFFDTDLGYPIWWSGTTWVKADGTSA